MKMYDCRPGLAGQDLQNRSMLTILNRRLNWSCVSTYREVCQTKEELCAKPRRYVPKHRGAPVSSHALGEPRGLDLNRPRHLQQWYHRRTSSQVVRRPWASPGADTCKYADTSVQYGRSPQLGKPRPCCLRKSMMCLTPVFPHHPFRPCTPAPCPTLLDGCSPSHWPGLLKRVRRARAKLLLAVIMSPVPASVSPNVIFWFFI